MVSILLERGASLDFRNKNGMNVLMQAADFGDFVVMRKLLRDRNVLTEAVQFLHAGVPAGVLVQLK